MHSMSKPTKIIFLKPGEKYYPEKEKFKNDLDELFLIIQDAHYAYEIWWILIGKEWRRQYFKVFLNFKEFFEPIARANLTAMVIALFKLYEGKNSTLNFTKILNKAEQLGSLNIATNNKLKRKLSEVKKIWKKICILRHNFLAHRNYFMTKEEIYKLAKITPDQIKRMIDLSIKIFNTFWMKIEKYPRRIDKFTSRDTLRILKALKAYASSF